LRVVEEALSGRMRVTDIVGTPSTAPDIERWRSAGTLTDIDVSFTDDRTFRTLADSVHPQGVLAVLEERVLELAQLSAAVPVLILDRLQDPGNAGTLLRSLHATGGSAVIALWGTVDLFNSKVVRSSAGSLFHLDVAGPVHAEAVLEWLAAAGLPLFALDRKGESLFVHDQPVPEGFALAVGNETAGLSPRFLARADCALALPMASGVDSLNAGVAGSIALYELWRRRLVLDRDRSAT
jgi:TrmH family RNA methyltransferase